MEGAEQLVSGCQSRNLRGHFAAVFTQAELEKPNGQRWQLQTEGLRVRNQGTGQDWGSRGKIQDKDN